MPKPTTMTGWWKDLLDKRAGGRIGLLAELCGVDVRTLHRYQSSDIAKPGLERRKIIRKVAGKTLVNQSNCPTYLRLKKKVNA